jgi:hypothetical protein
MEGRRGQRPEGGVAAGFIGGDALYGFFDFGVPFSFRNTSHVSAGICSLSAR